ncbi:MAG TPA: alpha/beta fold hydrolase [Burkholderiales bacterium]|nr:alpha/beta fold hydrolase [Burkholderiales bacterium]
MLEPSASPGAALFVCAHGAGGRMDDRAMLATSAALRGRGIDVVRFNFLYTERGSRRPDPMPRLRECYEAVVAQVRRSDRRLIIGGRSMGGRVATMLAADGFACDGLLLFAYPLHPAGQPEKLRDAHLPSIKMPVLCFNGTRDALCRRDLMERALQTVQTRWDMHWIDGADHSLKGDKILAEIADATTAWLTGALRGAQVTPPL